MFPPSCVSVEIKIAWNFQFAVKARCKYVNQKTANQSLQFQQVRESITEGPN